MKRITFQIKWSHTLGCFSLIFYKQLFHTKVFFKAFLYLQFGIVIFWQKETSAKAACKMLVKLTAG